MGGSGGGYFPSRPQELQNLIQQSQQDTKRQALEGEINEYLLSLLAVLNERNSQSTREQLDKILNVLSEAIDAERLLFGGSVAKHTYVDGLSDVDALVILDGDKYAQKSSSQVLGALYRHLKNELSTSVYTEIRKGEMAVTVTLRDGTELQLVPALKMGKTVSVPNRSGDWITTDPKAFQKQLTPEQA